MQSKKIWVSGFDANEKVGTISKAEGEEKRGERALRFFYAML